MKKFIFGFGFLLTLISPSFSSSPNDYAWMDKYYLVARFTPHDPSLLQKMDLELSPKQIELIKAEYDKYFPIMLGKARILKDKEAELTDAVYKSNDPQKIKNLVIEIAKLKTELTVLDINLFKAIQSILNKSQNEKFIKYLTSGSM
jgi:hypothetical protein